MFGSYKWSRCKRSQRCFVAEVASVAVVRAVCVSGLKWWFAAEDVSAAVVFGVCIE